MQWNVKGHATHTFPTKTSGFILYTKFENKCKRLEKFDGTLETTIPTMVGNMMLPSSVNGKLISVSYELVFFIKHDAWNEFGQGHKIVHPINIVHDTSQLIQGAVNALAVQPQMMAP